MKILADTSLWVECLRSKESLIADKLSRGDVLTHDYVLGEIVLGGISPTKLAALLDLRRCRCASHDEVLELIAKRKLAGRGLGYVDCHLLAAALLNGVPLWTLDKALQVTANELGCGMAMH